MKKIIFSRFFSLFLAVALLLAAYFVYDFNNSKYSNKESLARFQEIINKKEAKAKELLLMLTSQNDSLRTPKFFKNFSSGVYDEYLKENIQFFRYRNDTLRFWSSNQIPLENQLQTICLDNSVVKLKNGWYRVMQSPKRVRQVFVIYPIKQSYFIQNEYLHNQFPFYPSFSATTEVLLDSKAENTIKDTEGNFLFSLHSISFNVNQNVNYLVIVLIVLAFIMMVLTHLKMITNSNKKNLHFIGFVIVLSLLRLFMLVFKWPAFIYDLPLFNPVVFANSFFNASLGEVLFNTFYIAFIVIYLRVLILPSILAKELDKKLYFNYSLAILFHVGFTLFLIEIVPSFVKDSTLKFDPTNIISFEPLAWLGLIIISFLVAVYVLWLDFYFKSFWRINKLVLLLSFVGIGLFVFKQSNNEFVYALSFYIITHGFFVISTSLNKKVFSVPVVILGIICVSVLFSAVIYNQVDIKQKEQLRLMADNFSQERDPIAEYLFNEVSTKIKNDTLLDWQLKQKNDKVEVYKRISTNNFSGYWDKYNTTIVAYDSLCNVLLKPASMVEDRLLFYEETEKKQTSLSAQAQFYSFLSSADLSGSYLGKISKRDKNNRLVYNLYVELKPKINYAEFGFPSLLLEKKINENQIDFSGFSFAKYLQGKLVSNFGLYNYHTSLSSYNSVKNDFIETDEFIHVSKKINQKNVIVVSRKSLGSTELLNLFSYWFLLLLFAAFVVFIIYQIYNKFNLFTNHLRNRIQALLVITITIIFALVAWWNISFIKTQYASKNSSYLNEKTNSILLELQGKLGSETTINYSTNEYLNYLLIKFSNVFYTDLNLFDRRGNLVSTSRSAIFDNGLMSKKIHPLAYNKLILENESKFIHTEGIGDLKYLSSFVPFFNNEGNLLAYINLPYFTKQSDLETEISSVIVSLLSIYVLFFVFSISMAVFISNRIVLPLKILQSKLKSFQLNQQNEAITWTANDEIGALIFEYNKMINELASSAEKLAKSEREGAWREMAKQVAHEIKNPLTPMKLNVQQFQRTWMSSTDEEKQKQIDKFSSAMIEQIDTLSTIASEFSNFAQMPKPQFSKLNLSNLIKDVAHLFEGDKSVKIECHLQENIFVEGDKDQLIRVLNNLIKNALQSFIHTDSNQITIELKSINNKAFIKVIDNGTGISEEIKDKIFTPNFTTKTNGMGLGLAMVKSTIESHNGTIYFEKNTPNGTIFTIELNVV